MLDFFHMKLNLGGTYLFLWKKQTFTLRVNILQFNNALDQIIHDKPTLFFIKDD